MDISLKSGFFGLSSFFAFIIMYEKIAKGFGFIRPDFSFFGKKRVDIRP